MNLIVGTSHCFKILRSYGDGNQVWFGLIHYSAFSATEAM